MYMHVSRMNINCTSIQITLNHVHFQRENGLENERQRLGIVCEFMLGYHEKLVLNKKKYEIGVTKNHLYAELLKL